MPLFNDINNNGYSDMPMYKMYLDFVKEKELEEKFNSDLDLTTILRSYTRDMGESVDEIANLLDEIKTEHNNYEEVLVKIDKILKKSTEVRKNINEQYKIIMESFNNKPNKKYTEYLMYIIEICSKEEKNEKKYLKLKSAFLDMKYTELAKYYD